MWYSRVPASGNLVRVTTRLPDLTVFDTEGREVKLRDLAADRQLLVAYIRHFG